MEGVQQIDVIGIIHIFVLDGIAEAKIYEIDSDLIQTIVTAFDGNNISSGAIRGRGLSYIDLIARTIQA